MKTSKKGISLIVLVITIIVMIILAAAIIITLANNGIIGKANEAVEGMTEAQVREAANLAWADIYLGGNQIDDWAEAIRSHLEANGISKTELDKYEIVADENGVTKVELKTKLNEYGFYYDMFYTWEETDSNGNSQKMAVSFNRDGTAALYEDVSSLDDLEDIGVSVMFNESAYSCQMAGEATFSKETVSIEIYGQSCLGTFENDGKTCKFTLPGAATETVANLSTISLCGGPTYNKAYKGSFTSGDDIDLPFNELSIAVDKENNQVILRYSKGESDTVNKILEIKNIFAKGHYIETTDSVFSYITITPDGKHIFLMGIYPVQLTDEVVEGPEIIPVEGSSIENIKAGNPKAGDKVIYDGYTYIYNNAYIASFSSWMNTEGVSGYPQNSWGVRVNDLNQESYPNVLSSLYNIQVKSQDGTFAGCKNLKVAPKLSENAETFLHSFYNCEVLTKVVIPEKAINLAYAFLNCKSLTDVSEIPSSVTKMHHTFSGCESLVSIKNIPYGVTTLYATFVDCKALTSCPTIPSTVTDMGSTFDGCINLETAPIIPSSVDNMLFTFVDCTSLTGDVTINANPSDCSLCFSGTTKTITIKGSCSSATKKSLAESSSAGNVKY